MTALGPIGTYLSRLMAGGTLEIVLLIVIFIVALVVLVILLWVLWKLLVLLGKGLLWLFQWGSGKLKERSAVKRDEKLAAPPAVATGWSMATGLGLRRALIQARSLAGPDSDYIVIIAGEGTAGLYRSLGLSPPGLGSIGVSAASGIVLIDASRADTGMLRRLARALPWRRPIDALAVTVDANGIPSETLPRSISMARNLGMQLALHFVFPTAERAVWRVINGQNGDTVCSQLAADAVRDWLSEGSREGLQELALAQSGDLPLVIDRTLALASASVDIASLSLGAGLRAAVAQTSERTRPSGGGARAVYAMMAAVATGIVLTALAIGVGIDRAAKLNDAVHAAVREASAGWTATGVDTIPSAGRARRLAGMGLRLTDASDFSPLLPLAPFVPNSSAAQRLGGVLLESYLLVPLADALHSQASRQLAPGDDPQRWVDAAQVASEWIAAWDGLADDPQEVDLRKLLAAGFGGTEDAWAEGADLALVRTNAEPPPPERGGLDKDRLVESARANFIVTMQRWADVFYTNGPVASAARRAIERSQNWREQYEALSDLRTALQDPSQQWLTAAQDRPDYAFELRILGRAVALPLLGQAIAVEAMAAVRQIRLDARENVEYFILPHVGPLMVRSSTGSQDAGRGPSLTLTPGAQAWLAFLDRVANAGFGDLPRGPARPLPLGPVTMDQAAVAEANNKLRVFDQFAANLPTDLPPTVAQALLREITSDLVVGIVVSIEQALRPRMPIGVPSEQARQLAAVAPSLDALREIEGWLRERTATVEADRVLVVRGRIEQTVLEASSDALAEEDPLGMYPDPAADGNALVRRFERGVARLRRIHELFAAPFLESGAASGSAAVNWLDITDDLRAFDRGDTQAALSGLEGMVRAYADDADASCDAPLPLLPAGRDDYVLRSASRFRTTLSDACETLDAERARGAYADIRAYFVREVAWRWPYSVDPAAPELQPSTMDAFATRLHADRARLATIETRLASLLVDNAAFWQTDDDGGAVVRFRIEWRSRPSAEQLAEHVIDMAIAGASQDEEGVYTWRYGTPFQLEMRLATNSPYRFASVTGDTPQTFVLGDSGNGGFLRTFSELTQGAVTFDIDVLSEDDVPAKLRLTARLSDADGAPITMPEFSALSAALQD